MGTSDKKFKWDKKTCIIIGIVIAIVLIAGIFIGVLFSKKDNDVVIKDNVIIITGETSQEDRPQIIEDNLLVFDNNPNYRVGEVLVSGVTKEAPHGYFRKIVAIQEKDEKYYYVTEAATLLDVFEKAHITETIVLTADEGTLSRLGGYEQLVYNSDMLNCLLASNLFSVNDRVDNEYLDDLFNVEFEGYVDEDVHIEGEVGVKIWLDITLDIENGELEWGMSANTRTHGDILFGFSASKDDDFEEELIKIMPPTFTIWAGPVPIVVTNEVRCQLEGEYEITGDIGTTVELDSTLTAGFTYTSKDNKVQEITGQLMPAGGMEWESSVGVEGHANAGIFVYLTTLLYDCSGSDIGIGLEGQVKGEVRLPINSELEGSLKMSIYPQIKGDIVVEVPVLSKDLLKVSIFEKSLKPLWEEEWSNEPQEDVVTPSDDEILNKLINGDFSDFAGSYIATKESNNACGGGQDLYDLVLSVDGRLSGGGAYYSTDFYPSVKPISVTKQEDGSYWCQMTEDSYYIIYPIGVIENRDYVSENQPYLQDTIYINCVVIDGGVLDLTYYMEQTEEPEVEGTDYDGIDWVALGEFKEEIGTTFISGTGRKYLVIDIEINDDAGRTRLVLEAENGEKCMINNLPAFKVDAGISFVDIYEYVDSPNYN